MSHHGDDPSGSPIPESIRQAINNAHNMIGALGTHPQGKLTPSDDGAIQFAIGVKDGKVCIDFGTPVAWLGMQPGEALQLAQSLIEHARKAAKGTGSILTLNI